MFGVAITAPEVSRTGRGQLLSMGRESRLASETSACASKIDLILTESQSHCSKQLPRVGLSLAKKAPCFALDWSLAPAIFSIPNGFQTSG